MTTPTTLIIGKQGKTGRKVNALMNQAGLATRPVSRTTTPAFDWEDPQGWAQAMAGCRSAYVTFQPDLAVPAAQAAMAQFIRSARQVGIEHIVLLSGRGEDGAQQAEQQLITSGLTWNVVRAAWFNQNFSEGFLLDGIVGGQVALPAGAVPEPFVDTDDIAAVAVACLTQPALANQLFEVTGPELLTFRDCVAVIAEVIQRPVEFVPISAQQLVAGLQQQNLPQEMQWLINELFTVVMDGRNSRCADGVERALGRKPKSFREYAQHTALAGVWSPA